MNSQAKASARRHSLSIIGDRDSVAEFGSREHTGLTEVPLRGADPLRPFRETSDLPEGVEARDTKPVRVQHFHKSRMFGDARASRAVSAFSAAPWNFSGTRGANSRSSTSCRTSSSHVARAASSRCDRRAASVAGSSTSSVRRDTTAGGRRGKCVGGIPRTDDSRASSRVSTLRVPASILAIIVRSRCTAVASCSCDMSAAPRHSRTRSPTSAHSPNIDLAGTAPGAVPEHVRRTGEPDVISRGRRRSLFRRCRPRR